MNVYFHIDEIGRDAVIASALKKEFKKNGAKLFYGNRLYTYRLLKYFLHMFDVIILPRPMFLDSIDGANGDLPKIVVLPTEAIGRVSLEENYKLALCNIFDKPFMSGDTKYVNKVSRFLLWGKSTLFPVEKYKPELLDKVYVVGHPRYDAACFFDKNKIKRDEEIINVGMITRQGMLNDFLQRSVISCVLDYAAQEGVQYEYYNEETDDCLESQAGSPIDRAYLEASDIAIIIELIQKLNKHDNVRLFLKVHPREDRGVWEGFFSKHNLIVELAEWRTPYMHWVSHLDYVIGSASTTFYDSYVAGVQPICTSKIDKLRLAHLHDGAEEFNALMEFVPQPESVDEVVSTIVSNSKAFVMGEGIKEVLNKETNYPLSKSSISNIADQCILLTEDNKKKNSLVDEWFFHVFGKILNVVFYAYRRLYKKMSEQGSTFLLNKKNREYIDALAVTDEAINKKSRLK
jgi:hypothetical protein